MTLCTKNSLWCWPFKYSVGFLNRSCYARNGREEAMLGLRLVTVLPKEGVRRGDYAIEDDVPRVERY